MADRPAPPSVSHPYVGLRRFEPSDAHLFFGRDEQTAALVERLQSSRFLAVVGTSGSGKSSLVRAGLIPALQRGAISRNAAGWRTLIMNPAGAPMDNLAAAMLDQRFDVTALRAHSHGLLDGIRAYADNDNVLVVVDQFEELFRYEDTEAHSAAAIARRTTASSEAHEFVRLLLTTVREHASVYVVLTIRSDYIGDCAVFAELPEALTEAQYLVPRLTREQRRMAIEGPLGGRVVMEPALVQRILNETGDEPDQLPVMQHALMRTWDHWHGTAPQPAQITAQDYEAIGTVDKAMNQHARECLEALDDRQRAVAECIFKRLTARGRSLRERRDPATMAELWEVCGAQTEQARRAVSEIVERFRSLDAAFLTVTSAGRKHGVDPTESMRSPADSVDITHESLIRKWETLSIWVDEEQRSAEVLHELHRVAQRWQSRPAPRPRSDDDLLRGLVLEDAIRWQEQRTPTPAWAAQYIDSSDLANVDGLIEASRQAERRRSRRHRWLIGGLTAGLATMLVLFLAFIWYFVQVKRQETEARAAQLHLEGENLSRSSDRVDEALLKSLASLRLAPSAAADDAVRRYTRLLPQTQVVLKPQSAAPVMALSFTRDGQFLVALPEGRQLLVWRRDGWKQTATISAVSRINAFALHPDRPLIGAVDSAGHVAIHDLTDGKTIASLTPADGGTESSAIANSSRRLNAIAFDGGTRVAAAGDDAIIRVWDWQSSKLLASLAGHGAPVHHLVFGPDNGLASAGDDGGVWLWSLRDGGKQIRRFAGEVVASLQFSWPCSELERLLPLAGRPVELLATGYDGRIRGYDVEGSTGPAVDLGGVASFAGDMSVGSCGAAALGDDVKRNGSPSIRLSGTAIPDLMRRVGAAKSSRISLTRGAVVALGDWSWSRVFWYALQSFLREGEAEAARLLHRGPASAAAMPWDRGHVAIGTVDGEVLAWSSSTITGNRTMSVDWNGVVEPQRRGLTAREVVSASGAIAARVTDRALEWRELSGGSVVRRIPFPSQPNSDPRAILELTPEGTRAVFVSGTQVFTFDLQAGTAALLPLEGATTFESVQFEDHAMLLASGGGFALYSSDGLQLLGTAAFNVRGAALSQRGDRVAAWDDRGNLRMWTNSAAGLARVEDSWSGVREAVFDQRGRLVTCGQGELLVIDPTGTDDERQYQLDCTTIAAARSARIIVAATRDRGTVIIRGDGDPETLPAEFSGYAAQAVALDPAGGRLGALLENGRIRVFSLHGGGFTARLFGQRDREIALVPVDVEHGMPRSIVFSNDGRFISMGGSHYLLAVDELSKEACRRLRATQQGTGVRRDIEDFCSGL